MLGILKPKGFNMKRAKRVWNLLSLGALMAFLAACHKDPTPQPNPDHPTDPIIPTKEITITWSWSIGMGLAPSKDTIAFYTNDPSVKYVFIHLLPIENLQSTWCPTDFHRARDSLQKRINMDPNKVHGSGVVKVGRDGAHVDTAINDYYCFGMWEPDSLWFKQNGWNVERYSKSK